MRKSCSDFVADWQRLWEPDLEAIAYNGTSCDPTRVEPEVLQWVKKNCANLPHFIKIINKNATRKAHACHLVVPLPFAKEHVRDLQRVVTLENDEGETWKVAFWIWRRRGRNHGLEMRLLQGWKQVAADNDLQPGEVVVFVLVTNSRFHFTRFDQHGNLIKKSTVTNLADKHIDKK